MAAVTKKPSPFIRTMRRAALPALGLTIVAFFGAYAVLGRNGCSLMASISVSW